MKRFAGLLIVLAGCFWGVMGVFVRTFTANGFTTMQIAALRLLVAAGLMILLLVVTKPKRLKIRMQDVPLLAVLGVVSIGLMGVLYFTTIQLSSLSVAAVLLYLSPAAVLLMSALFFKEKITPLKLVALVLAVSGCALVSGIVGGGSVGWSALVTGIGSAVTYGSYSIIGPVALKKYHPFTVTAYAFLSAALFLCCLCNPKALIHTISIQPDGWVFASLTLLLGLCTAFIPFVLYTLGLQHTNPSRAAVLACSEPVAATLFGMAVYGERLTLVAYGGIALVLIAIVLLSKNNEKTDS